MATTAFWDQTFSCKSVDLLWHSALSPSDMAHDLIRMPRVLSRFMEMLEQDSRLNLIWTCRRPCADYLATLRAVEHYGEPAHWTPYPAWYRWRVEIYVTFERPLSMYGRRWGLGEHLFDTEFWPSLGSLERHLLAEYLSVQGMWDTVRVALTWESWDCMGRCWEPTMLR